MYNNSYNQLNQNQYYQINQNKFIPNINQNFGNIYPNQQQNYNLNNIIQLNSNQNLYNNQTKIQNFQIPNTNQNHHQIISQNNPQNQILNNNIQFINNNNNLNNINYNNIPFLFQNNINQNIQNNNNKQILINNIPFKNNNNIYKVETKIKNECDTDHAKGIPEKIIDKLYNSIVKIKLNNGLNATGFFMKIKIKEKEMKCLFTCQHVISQDNIKNKITFNVYYGKNDNERYRQIKLDNDIRDIKVFKEEDVTLIEIIEKDKISENKYLKADLNYQYGYYIYKDKNLYLAGYPKYFNSRTISSGKIKEIIEDYKFSHTLDTNFGSSGSPICNEIGDVIGIHTSGDEGKKIKYGIFIGRIIDTLINKQNEIKNYIIVELYISDEDINKDIRIINSYEQAKREDEYNFIEGDYKNENEKEIKEKCIIKINGIVIPFCYLYKFKTSEKYTIEYLFYNFITNTNYMFYDCSFLTNLNLSNFNTTNVTNMSCMFDGCSSLRNLNLSNFNTTNVTNMFGMFERCSSLTNLNLSNFNTKNVTNMSKMFLGCLSLTNLNLSNFNTKNVTNMFGMFENCSSLKNLNLSNFNTTNVTNMCKMFFECSSLTNLNLSNFNTTNVTDMSCMFFQCFSLTNLNISKTNEKFCINMIKESKYK